MVGQKKKPDNPMPVIDDDWWTSLLAEESGSSTPLPAHLVGSRPEVGEEAQTISSEKKLVTDWSQVKDLYMRDQIIDLTVTGHNRGGLLVEGNGLYGFVPFSHLVDLAGKVENPERSHELESYVGRSLHLKVIECIPE
ncbi:MAG: hypothetical protein Q8O48_01005, partial [Anaerolineales bacterium]|nr:hypothetical protein [Anaerolineales bacterium]